MSHARGHDDLILPLPSQQYNASHEALRDDALKKANRRNHKRGEDIEVGPNCRLIFTDPDGVRWAMTLNNTGAPVFTSL